MDNTKNEWEYFGETDPYYAVSTFDKFRKENLSEAAKDDFFLSGEEHIQKIWEEIENHFIENFHPQKALDFGCGVGRLIIPLAKRANEVVGIDISRSMLKEAASNCQHRNVKNVTLLETNEFLNLDQKKYDLVHSFIVLQHINPEQGIPIIKKMIESLADGGIGALHLTYSTSNPNFWRFKLYRDYPFINRLKNIAKGNKNEPLMPMYLYNLNQVFTILQENDCHKCFLRFSFHGMNGVVIFFQKKAELLY